MGMRHVWLRAAGTAATAGDPNGGPCCPGDVVIAWLAELRGLDL
jgi:hypothetical protein